MQCLFKSSSLPAVGDHVLSIISDTDAPRSHGAKLSSIFSLRISLFLFSPSTFPLSQSCPFLVTCPKEMDCPMGNGVSTTVKEWATEHKDRGKCIDDMRTLCSDRSEPIKATVGTITLWYTRK
ncbi:hypothetical protein BsWGS_19070 [Bradybaena similaris]